MAVSQPKFVSFGARLLGIRLTSETDEFAPTDEFEAYSLPEPPQRDLFEPSDSVLIPWDVPDEPIDVVKMDTPVTAYQDYPDYRVDDIPLTELEPITDFDFGYASLAAPLTSEVVPTAENSTAFDGIENDFSVWNQNLTQVPEMLEGFGPEEIVLYEPPTSFEQQPADGFARSRGKPIAVPSNPFPPENYTQPPPSAQSFPVGDLGANQRLHVDANLVEIIPLPGAEIVARVGTEIILGCDILPEAKKIAYFEIQDKLKKLPPEERQKVTAQEIQEQQDIIVQQVFPMILDQHVRFTLIYCDFASGRKKEEIQPIEKRVGDSFEEGELPRLMKQFEAGNRMELNNALERLIGSSIEREKALFVRRTIAQHIIRSTIMDAEGECTHEEMLNYYEEHKGDFFHKAKAKWLQLTVNITSSFTKEQAREKIVWMGNHVANGVPFEQVAFDHSDGFTAKNGGFNDWVTKGSLVSEALEQAVFQGQIGALSPIIEDRSALHIVKVLEREDEYHTPFLQAQSPIKKKIKELRRNKKEAEYFTELFRKFQPETYQNNVTNFTQPQSKTALPQGGTSLHAR